MIKLIIFDWDDVFTLGSKEGYFACYHKALEVVGVKLPDQEFRRRIVEHWGQSARSEITHLLQEKPELVDLALSTYKKALLDGTFVRQVKIIPGSISTILQLKKRYLLGLATGIDPHNFKDICTTFNFPPVFSKIIFSSQIKDPQKAKPHPYMVKKIMKELRVAPQATVVVGDAGNDVGMAQNAGVTPIVVLTGHLTRVEAEELNVKYIISDVTKIDSVLQGL